MQKKYRYYFSSNQKEIISRHSGVRSPFFCEVYSDGEWKEYTECISSESPSQSNFMDVVFICDGIRPLRFNGYIDNKDLFRNEIIENILA